MVTTVTGFTADRMLAIENSTVVDGNIVGDNLILLTRDGTLIDAGNVRGPQGIVGPMGEISQAELDAAIAAATAAGAITATMLAAGSVETAKIADGAVTAIKLAVASVTSPAIAVDSIMLEHMRDGSVGTAELVDACVTGVKIAAGTISGSKIAANTITASNIAASTIDATKIANATLTAAKLLDSGSGGVIDRGLSGSVNYCKILNWVHVYGNATSADSTWGTLPAGYRPNVAVSVPCTNTLSTPNQNRVVIQTTGVINSPSPGTASDLWYWSAVFPTTGI